MRVSGFSNQIVECVRIARLLTKHGEIFLERVYSPGEIAVCRAGKQPTQMFAAYWACKEAVLKIAGIEDRKRFDWREVEIVQKEGRLQALFRGSLEEMRQKRGFGELWINYSYTRNYAVANVIAVEDGEDIPF